MNRRRAVSTLLAAMLVVAGVGPAMAREVQSTNARAYAGTHVSFAANESAIVDYSVDGESMLDRVAVQSKSETKSDLGVGFELSSVTNVDGSAVDVASRTETRATVTTSSGATMDAHDNGNGVLVVRADGTAQVVEATVGDDARARVVSEDRVLVTTENGTTGTVVVVGDGEVTVAEDGDVTADLGSNATLVFRAYPDGRHAEDEATERMVANGTATAEVYVMQEGGKTVTDAVTYGRRTTVDAEQTAQNDVRVTVDRATHDGKVVVTHVSEAAAQNADSLSVTVDGEAAAQASSYAELRQAAAGGARSKYVVKQRASGGADVYVAFNHFSTRQATIHSDRSLPDATTSDDGTTDGSSSGDDTTDADADDGSNGARTDDGTTATGGDADDSAGELPGFGVGTAIAALVGAALVAVRRR